MDLLVRFSYENDDGQICCEMCKVDHALIEVLGDYLQDETQSEPVRGKIILAFANMSAEVNENIKEAVLQRGHLLAFFQTVCRANLKFSLNLPWIVFNLYCQQITLYLDSDEQFNLSLSLLGQVLSQL